MVDKMAGIMGKSDTQILTFESGWPAIKEMLKNSAIQYHAAAELDGVLCCV